MSPTTQSVKQIQLFWYCYIPECSNGWGLAFVIKVLAYPEVSKFFWNNCAHSCKKKFMCPKFCLKLIIKNTKCHISKKLLNFLKLFIMLPKIIGSYSNILLINWQKSKLVGTLLVILYQILTAHLKILAILLQSFPKFDATCQYIQ